jgi:hypothetical protein
VQYAGRAPGYTAITERETTYEKQNEMVSFDGNHNHALRFFSLNLYPAKSPGSG